MDNKKLYLGEGVEKKIKNKKNLSRGTWGKLICESGNIRVRLMVTRVEDRATGHQWMVASKQGAHQDWYRPADEWYQARWTRG